MGQVCPAAALGGGRGLEEREGEGKETQGRLPVQQKGTVASAVTRDSEEAGASPLQRMADQLHRVKYPALPEVV